MPDSGDARIVLHLEEHAVRRFILREKYGFSAFGVDVHAAELIEFEVSSEASDADLREDDGAGRCELDCDCENQHQRSKCDHGCEREKYIQKPFDEIGHGDREIPELHPENNGLSFPGTFFEFPGKSCELEIELFSGLVLHKKS